MPLNKKEFAKKEKELMQRAVEIEALNFDSDPGSYEQYRDGYRFMVRVSLFSFFMAFVFNAVSSVMVFFIEPSKSYATTRDGRILQVNPIATSFAEMKAIKNKYKDRPEVLLKMREHFNPDNNPNNKTAK